MRTLIRIVAVVAFCILMATLVVEAPEIVEKLSCWTLLGALFLETRLIARERLAKETS
jgi:hypothetical protein